MPAWVQTAWEQQIATGLLQALLGLLTVTAACTGLAAGCGASDDEGPCLQEYTREMYKCAIVIVQHLGYIVPHQRLLLSRTSGTQLQALLGL